MYTIALLIAVTSGGEALDAKRCGGGGCSTSSCYTASSCYGGCGSAASGTCTTPYYVPLPTTPPKKDGKMSMTTPAAALVVVNLPADARLFVDGEATTSKSETRVFITPELQPGKGFSYTMTAEVMRNGKPVSVEEKVSVRAGETTQVSFKLPTQEVASR